MDDKKRENLKVGFSVFFLENARYLRKKIGKPILRGACMRAILFIKNTFRGIPAYTVRPVRNIP